jgi:NodT family efflux transporter outer membrane factor (OMF) lipoprotein
MGQTKVVERTVENFFVREFCAMNRTSLSQLIGCMLLTACAAGPDYRTPETTTPAQFKAEKIQTETQGDATPGWQQVEPADFSQTVAWWTLFNDPLLDQLQRQVDISNQNLAQAEARYRQALAALRGTRAGFYPTLGTDVSYVRQGGGARTDDQGFTTSTSSKRYGAALNLNWELDLWGKLRRQLEANNASLQASAADLAGARLSAQSTLAQSYFQLRVLDEQIRLYNDTLAAYERSVQLTENQYRAGFVAKADMVQAQTQLERTRAQAIDLEWQRTQLENAIAVLTGKTPAEVRIAASTAALPNPVIPVSVPATLLQRRPDIASAERSMAAANARIGVAQAAWLPTLSLNASGGYQSSSDSGWFDLPNRYWSVGPALALALFDGGARRAVKDEAIASYDASAALYKQTVLDGFREVEDALARVQVVSREIEVQRRAVALAEEAEKLVTNQYRGGAVSYLNVITAQTATLESRRALLTLLGDRLTAGVQLIVALGGDWHRDRVVARD